MTLRCSAAGVPTPQLTWSFSGGALPSHETFDGGIRISLVENTPHFEGSYTCEASSRTGIINSTADLTVDGKLIFQLLSL